MMVCPLATPVPSLFAHTQCCRQLAGPHALFSSFGVYLGKRLHLQKNIVRFPDYMIAFRTLMEFRCEGILELFLRHLVIFVIDSSRMTSRLTRVTRQRESCLWWWEQSTFVIQHIENEPRRKGNQTSVSMKNAGNPRRATPESRQTLSCAVCADNHCRWRARHKKAAFTLRHLELFCVAAVVIDFGLEKEVYWRLDWACRFLVLSTVGFHNLTIGCEGSCQLYTKIRGHLHTKKQDCPFFLADGFPSCCVQCKYGFFLQI